MLSSAVCQSLKTLAKQNWYNQIVLLEKKNKKNKGKQLQYLNSKGQQKLRTSPLYHPEK